MSTVLRGNGVDTYASRVSQALRMVKRSRVDFKHGELGDNVVVPVPLDERER